MENTIETKNIVRAASRIQTPKSTHEIFQKLIETIEPINFENEVNTIGTSDVKIKQKEYVTISIDKIISTIKSEGLGLCISNNNTYLYNNCFWDVVSDDELKNFLILN